MWLRMRTAGENSSQISATTASEDVEARQHIHAIAEKQRSARGSIEYVSMPSVRGRGRRIVLVCVRIREFVGQVWRRLSDSHKFPGRPLSRVRLYRPFQTLPPLLLLWAFIGAACAILKFQLVRWDSPNWLDWLAEWGFPAAAGALLVTVWLDAFKSPFVARRIRHR